LDCSRARSRSKSRWEFGFRVRKMYFATSAPTSSQRASIDTNWPSRLDMSMGLPSSTKFTCCRICTSSQSSGTPRAFIAPTMRGMWP